MVHKINKMIDKIEKALTAGSFAEEGAFGQAEELLKQERRVLLAVRRGQVDAGTLKYAVNTCMRVRAGLDILYLSRELASGADSDPLLRDFLSELRTAGIEYAVTHRTGCMKQEIIDYTNAKSSVLFVVIESSEGLDVDCNSGDRRLSDLWQDLRCPLVVVADSMRA